MIVLFTDYGRNGPYTGMLKAKLCHLAPGVTVIDLLANAPAFNIKASAYLLNALSRQFPAGTIFLAVVDPGVGSERLPVVVHADGLWFVGPHNGLFDVVAHRSHETTIQIIDTSGFNLSESFHGRDLFAPVAAMIAQNDPYPTARTKQTDILHLDWPADCPEVIYIDDFGNAFTGIRASSLNKENIVIVSDREVTYARTFFAGRIQDAFWYGNSVGLVEIAIPEGSAQKTLGLEVGSGIIIK